MPARTRRPARNSKKSLQDQVETVAEQYPGKSVRTFAQDEARVGLLPIVRRVWSRIGERPDATTRLVYQWLYVFAFVHIATGQVVWQILPTVNTEAMSAALQDFAVNANVDAENPAVIVLDGAGWHSGKGLVIPPGVHLIFLPAYSPELQPAEHLWPLLREAIANRLYQNLDELDEAIGARCRELSDQPELIQSTVAFHWWPGDQCALPKQGDPEASVGAA